MPFFSQIKFEKAYFITNSGNRVECLIKNLDSKNSPSSFEYKISEDDKTKIANIKDVKLFEIYDQVKYVRSNVKLEQSSNNINQLSFTRTPDFKQQELFLKELATGDINLYSFTDALSTRYFYQIGSNDIEPLIYKPYEIEGSKIAYNKDYKKQLEKILVCPSINSQEIEKLEYKENSLIDLFIKYYKYSNPNYEEKLVKKKKDKLNLYIRPRINSSSVDLQNSQSNTAFDMENKIGFGFGIELEYVFPFNKNKWAIVAEPTYQSYKSEKTKDVDYLVGGKLITTVNYKSIELPIGIRYYMFINNKSKIFINAQYVSDLAIKSTIDSKRNDGSLVNSLNIKSRSNFAIGFGYNYNNKYSIEARYFTSRDITSDYLYWSSKYKNVSLIFSYNIF